MTKHILACFILVLASITVNVNAQSQQKKSNQQIGQAFDEIVVSLDLNVRRKSKENRQGKDYVLMNLPSGTTSPPGKSTALASRLVLSDGSSVQPDKYRRKRRGADTADRRLSGMSKIKQYLLRTDSVDYLAKL